MSSIQLKITRHAKKQKCDPQPGNQAVKGNRPQDDPDRIRKQDFETTN